MVKENHKLPNHYSQCQLHSFTIFSDANQVICLSFLGSFVNIIAGGHDIEWQINQNQPTPRPTQCQFHLNPMVGVQICT